MMPAMSQHAGQGRGYKYTALAPNGNLQAERQSILHTKPARIAIMMFMLGAIALTVAVG